MDNLQWFKFHYADWRMGKIQRCPEVTQARFINLCCLYWSKEANLTLEDAEIEIDKEHIDILITKKIIESDGDHVFIKFLDEQLAGIEEDKKGKQKAGKIGNLKRWFPEVYDKFIKKEITLDEALKLSQEDRTPIAPRSHPDRKTSQRREEEIREEKKKEEEEKETKKKVVFTPPVYEEFLDYALKVKSNLKEESVKLKFMAWKEAGWVDGNEKKINNWKSKLLNTIPHLQVIETKKRRVAL